MDEKRDINAIYNLAVDLAKKAGIIIKDAFYKEKHFETKSSSIDLVTETDKAVEKVIFDAIREVFPDHNCIGEETASASSEKCEFTDDPTWIVDPVDGTTNFVHRFPYVCVCIGVTIKKCTEVAVIYNPILDELFTAIKGKGAFCNGKKITVSQNTEITKSLIMTEYGSSGDQTMIEHVLKNIRSVFTTPVHTIHSLGSCALDITMVAQGSADAAYEMGIHCWDYCAASLIVTEAGGVAIDTGGGELDLMSRKYIAASNMNIAQMLSKRLEQIDLPRD